VTSFQTQDLYEDRGGAIHSYKRSSPEMDEDEFPYPDAPQVGVLAFRENHFQRKIGGTRQSFERVLFASLRSPQKYWKLLFKLPWVLWPKKNKEIIGDRFNTKYL
jgi:hypothetical protein